jgi:hypothetical protein
VVVHIEDKVLSHNSQANQADITHRVCHMLSKKAILPFRVNELFLIIPKWSDHYCGRSEAQSSAKRVKYNGVCLSTA